MKKIFAIVVSLMTLLMFSGVALSAQPAAPEKKKTAKVKKVHLQKSEYTNGPHVTIMGGAAFLTDSDVSENNKRGEVETDLGYALGVAAGYRFDAVRVEAELGYQKNEVDDVKGKDRTGDIKAYSLLVNGYYDLVRGKKIVPFITAGIGAAKVDADVNNFAHVDDIGLAYQVGAGLYYTITDNWHIELKYRFMGVAEIDGFGLDNLNPEFATHNVLLGLRYRF